MASPVAPLGRGDDNASNLCDGATRTGFPSGYAGFRFPPIRVCRRRRSPAKRPPAHPGLCVGQSHCAFVFVWWGKNGLCHLSHSPPPPRPRRPPQPCPSPPPPARAKLMVGPPPPHCVRAEAGGAAARPMPTVAAAVAAISAGANRDLVLIVGAFLGWILVLAPRVGRSVGACRSSCSRLGAGNKHYCVS